MSRDLSYRLEALLVRVALGLLAMLPVDWASALCGFLARKVVSRTKAGRRAAQNLAAVLPELSAADKARILVGAFDNLGRTIGEFPHAHKLARDDSRVEVIGLDACLSVLGRNKGGIFLAMHYGNLELSSLPCARLNLPQTNIYRAVRNPYLNAHLTRCRRRVADCDWLEKQNDNLRASLRLLAEGKFVGMMADYRESKGLLVDFMGREAWTNHAPALLASRTGAPVLIGRVVRTGGARYRFECRPIEMRDSGDRKADVVENTLRINRVIEGWIRERPELWMWTMRRWIF